MSRLLFLGIPVALLAAGGCHRGTPARNLLQPGTVAPELRAAEWVGGSAPTRDSLLGKVVVVDVWAYW